MTVRPAASTPHLLPRMPGQALQGARTWAGTTRIQDETGSMMLGRAMRTKQMEQQQ